MGTHYFTESKQMGDGNLINIQGDAGALLNAVPQKTGTYNPLWEFVPEENQPRVQKTERLSTIPVPLLLGTHNPNG
jgi:hypothetical protein